MNDQATEQGLTADAPRGWREIESAPDYEDVLLSIPRYEVGIDMPVMAVGERRSGVWYSCDSDEDHYKLRRPTHWMPLPPPPLYEQEQQG